MAFRARRGSPDPAAELDRRSPLLAGVFDNKSTSIVHVLFEETCGRPKRRSRETRAERGEALRHSETGTLWVLVLGRRATAEGSRGFQPTVGNHAKPFRRGATIEPSPHDWPPKECVLSSPHIQSSLRDEPFTRHRHPWVETHGYHQMSLRDGRPLDREFLRNCWERGIGCGPFLMLPFVSAGRERPPPQRGIPLSAQAIGLRARRGSPDPAAELDRRSPLFVRVVRNKKKRPAHSPFEETCGRPNGGVRRPAPSAGSPQRGGPHHRSSSSMTCCVLVPLRAAPLGLSDLWGLATQAAGLGWHRLAPSGLNRR